MRLIETIEIAVANKPTMGDACNNCGYCCLTEICSVGLEFTDKTIGPCPHIVQKQDNPDNHYCGLMIQLPELKEVMGAGAGCCAETQQESISRIMNGAN